MTHEDMYCPFCKSDDVREIGATLDWDSLYKCEDCKKIFTVIRYWEKEEGYWVNYNPSE